MGIIDPTAVDADTKVVPSVTVSERYDSNVFFSPQSAVPGKTLWDFVTAVTPEVKVQQKGGPIEGDFKVVGPVNAYVNNPGLNYFAADAALDLKLDNLMGRLVGRMRLQVSDYFHYSPEQPAFLTPKSPGAADPVLIGIQAYRANSLFNVAQAKGSYDISPTLSVQGSFVNAITRFGESFVPTTGPSFLLDTTTYTASAGPQIKLSPRDKASLFYTYSNTEITGAQGFSTNTMTAEYTRNLTPALEATINAGVTQVEPGGFTQPVGKAELNWRLSEDERWMIRYVRSVSANFFLSASALVSELFSAGVVHQFTQRLSMTANANYARNESLSGPEFQFTSYGAGLGFRYDVTRVLSASLQYDYYNFRYTSIEPYSRNAVMFSIGSTWP